MKRKILFEEEHDGMDRIVAEFSPIHDDWEIKYQEETDDGFETKNSEFLHDLRGRKDIPEYKKHIQRVVKSENTWFLNYSFYKRIIAGIVYAFITLLMCWKGDELVVQRLHSESKSIEIMSDILNE